MLRDYMTLQMVHGPYTFMAIVTRRGLWPQFEGSFASQAIQKVPLLLSLRAPI